MIIDRQIDSIKYCTECQDFLGRPGDIKYPLVLNWLITSSCNLDCLYCFATDVENRELAPEELVSWVKGSEFLKIVISGGEPFSNPNIWNIIGRITNSNKQIVIDTNGSYYFSPDECHFLKNNNIILRISLDSVNPHENTRLRCGDDRFFYKAISNIEKLTKKYAINVELQTVITKVNIKSLAELSQMVTYWGISKWYLQRLVPAGRGADLQNLAPSEGSVRFASKKFPLDVNKYIIKEDTNSKSVILLDNFGNLITEDSSGKLRLGNILNDPSLGGSLLDLINVPNHLKRYRLMPFARCNH